MTEVPPAWSRFVSSVRQFSAFGVAVICGYFTWSMQSLITGAPRYEPSWGGILLWFFASGLIVALVDPRSPTLAALGVYVGAYIVGLIGGPTDPLLPLALVLGILFSVATWAGTAIPCRMAQRLCSKLPICAWWCGQAGGDESLG